MKNFNHNFNSIPLLRETLLKVGQARAVRALAEEEAREIATELIHERTGRLVELNNEMARLAKFEATFTRAASEAEIELTDARREFELKQPALAMSDQPGFAGRREANVNMLEAAKRKLREATGHKRDNAARIRETAAEIKRLEKEVSMLQELESQSQS